MAAIPYREDPWRRLPMEVPAALLLTLLALIAFHKFLAGGAYAPSQPKPIVMDVVELPPAPPPPLVQPEVAPSQPQVQQEAAPVAAPKEIERAVETPQARPVPTRTLPPPTRATKPAVPAPPAPVVTHPPAAPIAPAPEAARDVVPPAATAPLTAAEQTMIAEQRRRMADELYRPGDRRSIKDDGANRAAASEPGPPLTPEEWKALDEMFFTGSTNFIDQLAFWASMRAAASQPAPPLTREQWDALDRIYHVGGSGVYEEYRQRLAAMNSHESLATLADLTPDERRVILASRGVVPVRRGLAVTMSHKITLIDATDMVLYNLRGTPAIPIDLTIPELPDSLRQQPAEWTVVARLRVDRDGSTTVALSERTADETVDRAVLAALRRWRFRATYAQFQQPMASTIEVRLTLVVK